MTSYIGLWSRLAALLVLGIFLVGCDGDDGAAGAAGAVGADGQECWDLNGNGAGDLPDEDLNDDGLVDVLDCNPTANIVAAAVAEAEVEACATCHGGVGEEHTAIYDSYVDPSTLALTINSVTSVADGAGAFDVTVEFSITKDGLPFDDLVSLDEMRFYAVQYDSATGEYLNGNKRLNDNFAPGAVAGDHVVTESSVPFAPEGPWAAPFDGAHLYGYIAQGALFQHEGGAGAEIPEGSHVHLYDDVANAALAFGTADAADAGAYASAANVAGCEKCHGEPYLKHGYRDPIVAGLPDFASCKSCHYDDRGGGHWDWQYMVDDPSNWATAGLPDADVAAEYAYKAKLMNDVHMAHAMEFPYPQSMSNCATCHEGKLDLVLADSNFTAETCKSCHPVQGNDAWPEYELADGTEIDEEPYAQPNRAPPMAYLWTLAGVEAFHSIELDCASCHGVLVDVPTFDELHTGYDVSIANAAGERYRDLYSASIDNVSLADDVMTIEFSASDPAIVPELLVSFYGWDSKQYIVPSHMRDGTDRCVGRGGSAAGCDLEIAPGDTNPVFTSLDEVPPGSGSWVATLDLTQWIDGQPGFIPDLIGDGVIRKAEVTVTPELELMVAGHDHPIDVVLDAVGQTVDVGSGALIADYFKRDNAIVDTDKCDVCHDSLASSFHDGSGRGGGGIQVCKNCHNPTFPGSHVEMASRSIDNYVHAIHSFQDFDIEDTFEVFDPVLAKRYDQHIKHVFPRFTIRNCEACHVEAGKTGPDGGTYPVVYDVPDQSQSMPGVLSVSDPVATSYTMVDREVTEGCDPCIPETIAVEVPAGRSIGAVPEQVTGPASRACGGCHRGRLIKADAANELAAFNAHTKAGGTYVENDADGDPPDQVVYGVIDKIMTLFE
ncbi:MAG: hypothetical protein OER85_10075 [Gammaproteobacteria bacterium]|nr:hypothetical protein [Gammaproteobacteria bacterium]